MMTDQSGFHEDVLEQAFAWIQAGQNVALATVIETWGSAPRPVGSQLAINDAGDFVGSVSGGCVEGAVVEESLDLMKSNSHKVVEFGVSNSQAWEVGLACGGKIRILIETVSGEAGSS